MKKIFISVLLLVSLFGSIVYAKPLPVDPSIHQFKLKNGLTCWIKPHKTPPGKVSIWLHVGSGSLNEEENQRGLAHYLEHMAFNGSKNFPPDELIKYFEAMGLRFGQHQNAFTGFDQTTYQLAMPNVEDATIEKALICMSDFAYRLSLFPEEVKSEMGVIIEEKRARAGIQQRISDKRISLLFPGARIGERMPIGTLKVIKSATHDLLNSYYKTWYRPDLSTLIIVGDVDPAKMRKQIEAQFNDWKLPATTVTLKEVGIVPYSTQRSGIIADPELKTAYISILSVSGGSRMPTTDAYRAELVQDLGNWILSRRLQTMIREGKASFQSGGASSGYQFKDAFICTAQVSGHPKDTRAMLTELTQEIQRGRVHGFLPQELKQAIASTISGLERAVKAESTQDGRAIANKLNYNVTEGYLPMSAQQTLNLVKLLISNISLVEVNEAFKANYPTDKRMILAVLPENVKAYAGAKPVTDKAELLTIVQDTEKQQTTQQKGETEITKLLPQLPTPGKWIKAGIDADVNVFSGTLDNGTRVHIREMDYKKNQVTVRLTLTGGKIMEDIATKGLTDAAALTFRQAATTNFSSTQIRNFLNGKNVGVSAAVHGDSVSITISGSPQDIEYGFQLVHLLLTNPKLEASALQNWRKQFKMAYQQKQTIADARLGEELPKLLFPNTPRLFPMTPAEIDTITVEKAQAWLKQVIGNAMIEMAVVGDIKPDRAKELVSTYIGSLPKRPNTKAALDARRKLEIPQKAVSNIVDIESIANRSVVLVGWRTAGWSNKREVQALKVATMVLENHVREDIREKRGWTYSSTVFHNPSKVYDNSSFMGVYFTADPDKAEKAMKVAADIVINFTKEGPSEKEMSVVKKQLFNVLDKTMKEPSFWVSKLADLDYHGSSLDYIKSIRDTYESFTPDEIKSVIKKYITDTKRFELIVRKAK